MNWLQVGPWTWKTAALDLELKRTACFRGLAFSKLAPGTLNTYSTFLPLFNDMLKPLPSTLSKLLPKSTTELLSNHPRTLYETLSRLPHDGVGSRVFQTRWQSKGIRGCFWEVTRVKLKLNGTHGKAWGKLTWRGELSGPSISNRLFVVTF